MSDDKLELSHKQKSAIFLTVTPHTGQQMLKVTVSYK
jgi:hypothetical protein